MSDGHKRNASVRGYRSRADGQLWETMINRACDYYRDNGVAHITKTPEPLKVLGPANKLGQFTACFTKKAQPDYSGTLAYSGRSIVFEAKHTSTDRIRLGVVSDEQVRQLDQHHKFGALCFVLVSFDFARCFRVPWSVFRNMKEQFGRQYVTPDDLQPFEVSMHGGVPYFMAEEAVGYGGA